MHRAHAAWFIGVLLVGACAVGPSTRVTSAALPVRAAPLDSAISRDSRALLDSLVRARSVDRPGASVSGGAIWSPLRLTLSDTRDVAWLDVLRDTQLVVLVNEAVANNRDLRVARARIREYRAQVTVARSGLFPQITANANVSKNRIAFGTSLFQYASAQATADLSWELDLWGQTRRSTEAARLDLGAQEQDARFTTVSLVSDIATAYLQVRELDESVRITDETLVTRRATLALARQRYARGVISELDVRQFEADLADPAATLAALALQRAQAETRLAQLLGRPPGSIPRGRPLADVARAVTPPDSISAALIGSRPDVMASQRAWQASIARVGSVRASRLPGVTASVEYGAMRAGVASIARPTSEIYTLQLGASVPVFDAGRLSSEERVARARAEQARGQYEQTVLTASHESADALSGLRFGRDQLAARATQVQALGSAYVMAEQRYRSGVASYLEVLDAERQLFSAQLSLVQAQRQYLVATVDLYRVLGGGWNVAPPGRNQ
ncbi:MAG: efflux system, outer rane lipoprotein NodT family [Gemmatimonadetes bacterium]|nr:efflux system, outer rane lipoprotein NodT family [Gemmatimonadota bacterium]